MTVNTMVHLDNIIHILQNNKVRDLIEEGARWYYSDSGTTINLIPAFIVTGLVLFLLGPVVALIPRLLDTLAAIFEKPLVDTSGYGAPPTDSYGAPAAPAYGAPSYDGATQFRGVSYTNPHLFYIYPSLVQG